MIIKRVFLAAVVLVVVGMAACGDGDDDESDEDFVEAPPSEPSGQDERESRISPTAIAEPSSRPDSSTPGTSAPRPPSEAGLPSLTTMADVLFTDLRTGSPAFEVEIQLQFAENPTATIEPYDEGSANLLESVRANLKWVAEQGYDSIETFAIEGFGTLYLESPTLAPLVHEGLDYNAQYSGDPSDEELAVDEEEAFQRYHVIEGEILSMVLNEAHALGLSVTVNVESLAHIINRSLGTGIGGSSGELILAGNLPLPTVDQVLSFVDEVIAAGADAVSAEAYPPEYDQAIASHLAARNVPFVHTGPDLGTTWAGYYYSFYPDQEEVADVYMYLHSNCALLGTTNGGVFARARASSLQPETAVVVGAYNPYPCDTRLSLADVFGSDRPLPIDENEPRLDDGTVVPACGTGPWLNLLLVAARRQKVDRIWLTADMPASIAASSRDGFGGEILDRIAAHPAPEGPLRLANIILDLAQYTEDDGYTNADYFEGVSIGFVGLVDDALQAAGYQTILTYDEPWDGGAVDLTYVLTPGGNEETGDEGGMGPPYWTTAQSLPSDLLQLLDPAVHPGPVFIHPIFGVPEANGWDDVRGRFGLPGRFSYQNPTLTSLQEYHTSLVTSFFVTADGDTPDDALPLRVTPETATILGHSMVLPSYSDFSGIGLIANVAANEVPQGRVVAEGPLLVPGPSGTPVEQSTPYLVTDGDGRFLWLINQLHHQSFTYLVTQAVAQATGGLPVISEPTFAHVWSGPQTFALAYDNTDVALNLPFESGQPVDVTVYDMNGDPVRQDNGVPYNAPLRVALDKHSLLVVEPAR